MKTRIVIFLILFAVLIISCNSYGTKLEYQKTEVYFIDKVDKKDAEKLGDFLVRSEFADGNEKSVQVTLDETNGNYIFRMVTSKEASEKDYYETVFDDDNYIFEAIKAGANGYLLKEIEAEKLHKSLIEVLHDGAPMTPNIAMKTLNLLRKKDTKTQPKTPEEQEIQLSKRETEILLHLSKGLNYNNIANNLMISPSTVRKHIEKTAST